MSRKRPDLSIGKQRCKKNFMTTKNYTIRMVDTVGQYQRIRTEIDKGIQEVLETGAYINGPQVKKFAENLSNYLGVAQTIPCANGTDALQIALMALGLKPGDEVITPSFTFAATAEVIALLGLIPIFVDVNSGSFNMNPTELEKAITAKTKCIIPVHLFGQAADMETIMKIAKKHNLYVVEDNAQSIGADYFFSNGKKQKAGTIGHIGCTSFYPSKNLGAYGDAGALFTNDISLGEKIRVICNHGSKIKYYHSEIGINSRLDSIQAVILDVKLKHLDSFNNARQHAASAYDKAFANVTELEIPARVSWGSHVFHQYTLKIKGGKQTRDLLKQKLEENGIPAMVYYPVPLHVQEAYLPYSTSQRQLPVSEALATQVLSLPMHSELDNDQLLFISNRVIEILKSL